jgi:hypothetical protein
MAVGFIISITGLEKIHFFWPAPSLAVSIL